MAEEAWKPVIGAPGYEVSTLGRVRSVDRIVNTKNGQKRRYRGQPIAQALNNQGYPKAWITREGGRVFALVHILVAEAFIGPRPPGGEVCHGDGDPLNPSKENLRYASPKENAKDKIIHGTHLERRRHPAAKLTDHDVAMIRDRLGAGDTERSIAGDYGVTRSNIAAISQGRSWRAPALERLS